MSGKPAVRYTVLRLDLNDEVVMSTDMPHAAIQWVQKHPFAPAKMTAVYVLPQTEATPSPIRVVTITEMSSKLAKCSEVSGAGHFQEWLRS